MICLSHSWGGLEQVAAYDTIEINELGIEMGALVLADSPIHLHLKKYPFIKVYALPYRPRDLFDFNLKRDIDGFVADGLNLIHMHQPTLLGSIVPWLLRHWEVSLFVSRHILNNHNKKNIFHRFLYRRVDSLIVMSQALQRNVLKTHPVKSEQVSIINLGLDFKRFDPEQVDAKRQRADWGADDETIVIGLVGRIDPAKGQDTFIQAAAGLMNRYPDGKKLKFIIVGEETLGRTSSTLEDLKKMVSQFRLDPHVIFAGYQENIPEIMQAFDIFVMPSRQETFGLVAIEAMAMECPIIISSGGSADEIIGKEEVGLLMNPQDAFDLQRHLKTLIDNEELRKSMGRKAREHVIKNYDRKLRIQKTLALYERGLRQHSIIQF